MGMHRPSMNGNAFDYKAPIEGHVELHRLQQVNYFPACPILHTLHRPQPIMALGSRIQPFGRYNIDAQSFT